MTDLPLDEVRRRLRITSQSHGGLRAIEVARIVGSSTAPATAWTARAWTRRPV